MRRVSSSAGGFLSTAGVARHSERRYSYHSRASFAGFCYTIKLPGILVAAAAVLFVLASVPAEPPHWSRQSACLLRRG
jgi:hypothetical protein